MLSTKTETQYEKQLEIIGDACSYHVDSTYTAAPVPEGEDPWQVKVFKWLWEHDQAALEIVDDNTYMPGLTLRRVLPALIELDLLEKDSQLILRDVDIDGYRLQTWDCQEPHRRGFPQSAIYFRFTHPDGYVLFEGSDFGCSPMCSLDGDETVRSLLGFLTLRPGDTDLEYFDAYTEEQMDWAVSEAEALSMWAVEPERCTCHAEEDDPRPDCTDCGGTGWYGAPPVFEVEGEETFFKPWGWVDERV